MDNASPQNKTYLNPWQVILLTAPVPMLLFIFFFYKWYDQKAEFNRIRNHFLERQNSVIGFDSLEVATGLSDLLEKAARDVQILGLVPANEEAFRKFYFAQGGDYVHMDVNSDANTPAPLLFYNQLLFMKPSGEIALYLHRGQWQRNVRTVEDCRPKDLCDHGLLEKALTLPVGELEYGNVLRWYTPKGAIEDDDGASLSVAFRAPQGILLVGIDYRHIKDHLTTATFPYVPRRNLLQSYENGNYIYIIDGAGNIIAHPKYWHMAGVDRQTGEPVRPMRTDDDEGTHPLNIVAYQGERLKSYFDRLLKHSFQQKTVDIFQGVNLNGMIRVLSVAPVELEMGQFRTSGVFGHVVVGCAVDYFEEPKEKVVPYY
jgi:hypothetical protein